MKSMENSLKDKVAIVTGGLEESGKRSLRHSSKQERKYLYVHEPSPKPISVSQIEKRTLSAVMFAIART